MPVLHSIKNAARNEMESGFKKGTSKFWETPKQKHPRYLTARKIKNMPDYRRDEVLGRLRSELDSGKHLLAVGAGTGITAKFAERGGADLIVIYNSGRYRMSGLRLLRWPAWLTEMRTLSSWRWANAKCYPLSKRHQLSLASTAQTRRAG